MSFGLGGGVCPPHEAVAATAATAKNRTAFNCASTNPVEGSVSRAATQKVCGEVATFLAQIAKVGRESRPDRKFTPVAKPHGSLVDPLDSVGIDQVAAVDADEPVPLQC